MQRKERTQSRARKIGTARAQERERESEKALKPWCAFRLMCLKKRLQLHRFDFPCVLRIISRLSLSSHELPIQAHGSQSSGSEQGNVEP